MTDRHDRGPSEAGIRAAMQRQPQAVQKRWRHLKRGLTYIELARGTMQASDDGCLDMQPVVVYRSEKDGSIWCRPQDEFEDGRFEALPATEQPEAQDRSDIEALLRTFGQAGSEYWAKSDMMLGILAFIERQSAASAAAALRMAIDAVDAQITLKSSEEWDNGVEAARKAIERIATPAGTSALASMPEEAERKGILLGTDTAVNMVADGMADHDAQERNGWLEKAAAKFDNIAAELERMYFPGQASEQRDISDAIRALKSGSAANG